MQYDSTRCCRSTNFLHTNKNNNDKSLLLFFGLTIFPQLEKKFINILCINRVTSVDCCVQESSPSVLISKLITEPSFAITRFFLQVLHNAMWMSIINMFYYIAVISDVQYSSPRETLPGLQVELFLHYHTHGCFLYDQYTCRLYSLQVRYLSNLIQFTSAVHVIFYYCHVKFNKLYLQIEKYYMFKLI